MTYDEFILSIENDAEPHDMSIFLEALWWDAERRLAESTFCSRRFGGWQRMLGSCILTPQRRRYFKRRLLVPARRAKQAVNVFAGRMDNDRNGIAYLNFAGKQPFYRCNSLFKTIKSALPANWTIS
jgi:hypothetical protein